jgi:hypothetical protein
MAGCVVIVNERHKFMQFMQYVQYVLKANVDDVYLLGNNMNATKKNTEALIEFSKDVGLEAHTQRKISMC